VSPRSFGIEPPTLMIAGNAIGLTLEPHQVARVWEWVAVGLVSFPSTNLISLRIYASKGSDGMHAYFSALSSVSWTEQSSSSLTFNQCPAIATNFPVPLSRRRSQVAPSCSYASGDTTSFRPEGSRSKWEENSVSWPSPTRISP
jgi:hypothetical protein